MLRPLLRVAMTFAHRARSLLWRLTGRAPRGAHGIVLTTVGHVVLVRLTYAAGWHLPGGGLKRRETPREGVLRELREEIGLRAWHSLQDLGERDQRAGSVRLRNTIVVVHGATYQPRWSLEIAEVRAFDLLRLPSDLSPWARSMLEELGS